MAGDEDTSSSKKRSRESDDEQEIDEAFFKSIGMQSKNQIEAAIRGCHDQFVCSVGDLRLVGEIDGGIKDLFPQLGLRARVQSWYDEGKKKEQKEDDRQNTPAATTGAPAAPANNAITNMANPGAQIPPYSAMMMGLMQQPQFMNNTNPVIPKTRECRKVKYVLMDLYLNSLFLPLRIGHASELRYLAKTVNDRQFRGNKNFLSKVRQALDLVDCFWTVHVRQRAIFGGFASSAQALEAFSLIDTLVVKFLHYKSDPYELAPTAQRSSALIGVAEELQRKQLHGVVRENRPDWTSPATGGATLVRWIQDFEKQFKPRPKEARKPRSRRVKLLSKQQHETSTKEKDDDDTTNKEKEAATDSSSKGKDAPDATSTTI
ncbi:expressed unknown protein [Seminavis robusta]|uniref:Uncharacterized protein n=1 Tax=Seminavis robusta TaxID=568900 RepID=A0A9N8H1A8_9STRA|nr:expressed unknown protein [Seminavis robusta]|eukprot:Sro1_g000990.1 n/a (375) ;mRNA; f:304683-305807